MNDLTLAADFPAATQAQWISLVEKVLAGRDFERTLVTTSRDGIGIAPLYPQQADGRRVNGRIGPWSVFQRVDHPDIATANRLARDDIEGGASGLELVLPGAPAANGFGVDLRTSDDLVRLLDGIDLTSVKLRIDGGPRGVPALALATALVGKLQLEPGAIDIVASFDPASSIVSHGRLPAPRERFVARSSDLAHYIVETGLAIAPFVADGRAIHAGGGSDVQELAYCIADAVAHLHALGSDGLALADARTLITFVLAADADQFATTAKFRALRILWARVQDACGLTPEPARVHAETAWRMMTRRDPWVNLLRAAIATTAAGLGGADSVTVVPFTAALGLPDSFARRLARNTQLVLIEEAGLGRVADPTAGSGYVESLTRDLAEAAWTEFQRIESEGGVIGSLLSGAFQSRVAAVRDQRMADIARRKEPITGVSEYPFLDELPVQTLQQDGAGALPPGDAIDLPATARGARWAAQLAAVENGASVADLIATSGAPGDSAASLPARRLAEPFEHLRDLSDRLLHEAGRRPAVFLATIGSLADFAARAGFARNAFAAGGLESVAGEVYDDVEAMTAGFAASGARLACICGTDAGYAEHAAGYAKALKASGADLLFLAGRPGDRETELSDAGVDTFVYAGCDILTVLETAYRRLGIVIDQSGSAEGGEQ